MARGRRLLISLLFLLRIVAARLNGSLDFFTVEINKPPCLLQYRGERPPPAGERRGDPVSFPL